MTYTKRIYQFKQEVNSYHFTHKKTIPKARKSRAFRNGN